MSYEREGIRATRDECDTLEEENGVEQGWCSENLRGRVGGEIAKADGDSGEPGKPLKDG